MNIQVEQRIGLIEDAAYEYAMSSDYSYEKEEGRYQANLLISELQSNCFSADELPDRMERVRANLKKDLGDPQSFDEWDSHFTDAINKTMSAFDLYTGDEDGAV